jgi:hypothetical protein
MQTNTAEYWNKEWKNRIVDNVRTNGNWDKYEVIIKELFNRPYLNKLNKLEIGSGVCSVALRMLNIYPDWIDKYKCVEQSETAVNWVKQHKVDAVCSDIMDFETDEKFDVFMLFDVLEHIEDVDALAEKIKSMASDEYSIIGNIPLYTSEHDPEEGFERLMNIDMLNEDMAKMGCTEIAHSIYGSMGFPYMFWQSTGKKGVE